MMEQKPNCLSRMQTQNFLEIISPGRFFFLPFCNETNNLQLTLKYVDRKLNNTNVYH